jgi:hypothetical protein
LLPRKVQENISNLREYLKISPEAFNNLIIEYPILISNLTSDINKLAFYFNLYSEMNKEDFFALITKFPLILITTVFKYLIYSLITH